jgi:hypothetical protein
MIGTIVVPIETGRGGFSIITSQRNHDSELIMLLGTNVVINLEAPRLKSTSTTKTLCRVCYCIIINLNDNCGYVGRLGYMLGGRGESTLKSCRVRVGLVVFRGKVVAILSVGCFSECRIANGTEHRRRRVHEGACRTCCS